MLKLFMAIMAMFSFAQEGAGGAESGGEAGGADDSGAAGGEGGQGGATEGAQGGEGDGGGAQGGESGGEDAPDLSTAEGYLDFARKNGAFEKPEEYSIPTEFEGISEALAQQWDVKSDASMFAGMAAKYGLIQHQAEGIFKDYVANALEVSKAAEQADIDAQKPEVILKEVYGDKVQEAVPMFERGLKALNIDMSGGLRLTHAMKAIAEIGSLVGEDGSFHGAGTSGGKDEEMSTEDWLKEALN